ncbi:MAG: site-specific integrase [Acidimicrobiales bacterium]
MAGRIPTGIRLTPAGFYEARWYDASGERHSATFDTAAEADACRQEHLHRRRRGGTGDPTAGNTTFAEWWERWMAGRQTRPSTRATGLCYAINHLVPELGKWRLVEVRPSDIPAWVAKLMAAGLAPATVRTCRGRFSQCLKAAVTDRLLYQNPADATQPPAVPRKEARSLTPDELVRLETVMDPWRRCGCTPSPTPDCALARWRRCGCGM